MTDYMLLPDQPVSLAFATTACVILGVLFISLFYFAKLIPLLFCRCCIGAALGSKETHWPVLLLINLAEEKEMSRGRRYKSGHQGATAIRLAVVLKPKGQQPLAPFLSR